MSSLINIGKARNEIKKETAVKSEIRIITAMV